MQKLFFICFLLVLTSTVGWTKTTPVLKAPEIFLVDSLLMDLLKAANEPIFELDEKKTSNAINAGFSNNLESSSGPLALTDDMSDLKDEYTDNELSTLDKARSALLKVRTAAKFVQKFDGSSLVNLPIAMNQNLSGTEVTIVLNAIRIYSTYAALEVFVEVQRPDWKTPLIFYAPEITYSQEGGLSGLSSVGLIGNKLIPLDEGKTALIFRRASYDPSLKKFTSGTFLDFDCDGFKSLGLSAVIHFSKERLLSVLPNGKVDTVNRVRSEFSTIINDLDDMIFEISISEFIVPQCDRVSWTVNNAVFDFSETQKQFDFPLETIDYDPTINGAGYLPTNESWKGIFIRNFDFRWIDTIAQKTKSSMLGLSGYDLVIDHNGFTGYVELTGLLPIEDGDLDGWDFSIDRFGVEVIMNQASALEFEGMLIVPLLKKNEKESTTTESDELFYAGNFDFSERSYGLAIGLAEEKVFDIGIFKGRATIYNNSYLDLEYREDEGYGIEAVLHGRFDIPNAKIGEKKLNLPAVEFVGVHIASQKDFIRDFGAWGLPTDVGGSFLGFGYNVNALQIDGQNEDAEFRVIANINFAAKDGIYVSAGGAFRLQGKVELDGVSKKQRYNYKTLKVDMIEVAADLAAVSFAGYIIFYKDVENWGSGFQGKLEIYIKGANDSAESEPSMGLAALALFGTNSLDNGESYRYFMVDLLARLGAGITIPNTGMKLKGIGGGVYYHMNQLSVTQDIQNKPFEPGDPQDQPDVYMDWMLARIGTSLSGTKYIPDDKVSFGVNATVVIALEKEEAFNANVTFTIQLNENYGISFIRIKGVCNFMAPVSWTAPSCSGVSAAIEMNFIFEEINGMSPGFYASAHVFLNIAVEDELIFIGSKLLSSAPSEYVNQMLIVCSADQIRYAGGLELEMTKNNFFINMGRPEPEERLQAAAKLGPSMAGVQAYMDIGTNIPPFPGLPANVAHLTNLGNVSEAGRATGNGFAYGASFNLDLLKMEYLVFKADIGLDAGFDIMLKQYEPTFCANTNENLGIYNWYAMGQAYAFMNAEVSGCWNIV